jgi:hypothetical protein
MRTSDQAQEIARSAVAQRYATAEVAFCAGSIVRGDGTAHSDIDLVVILPELKAAFRESFFHQGWSMEAFVHDAATLRYFFEEIDAKSGVPSLPQMVDEGLVVRGDQSVAGTYKQLAKQVLAKGPPALTAENIRNAIYGISRTSSMTFGPLAQGVKRSGRPRASMNSWAILPALQRLLVGNGQADFARPRAAGSGTSQGLRIRLRQAVCRGQRCRCHRPCRAHHRAARRICL